MVSLAQTVHLSCTDTNTISKEKKVRFHMTHVTMEFPRVCLKWFPSLCYARCKPCAYLASRLALSLNGPSFHLSLVTRDYHRVHLKRFQSRWHVWHKLYTYLAPTLTQSPNRDKWDATRPTSHKSSIGCVQNDFWAYGTFGANRAPILCQYSHYLWKDWNELPLVPRLLVVPSGMSNTISEPMVHLAQTMHLSCTNTNTVSKRKEERFHMTHIT